MMAHQFCLLALAFTVRAATPVGVLTYHAPEGPAENKMRLIRNGANLELIDDVTKVVIARRPLAGTVGVAIQGANGPVNDTLTVDFSGGTFPLPKGIRYDGG